MTNDPSRPTPDPEKITGKTPKQANEATELDLWDLDSDESDFAPPAAAPNEPAGLPARRKTGSSTLQSRKPVERHINIPAVEMIKVEEKTSAEEKPVVEKKAAIEKESADKADPEPRVVVEPPEEESHASEETDSANENPGEGEVAPESKATLPTIASLTKIEKIAISCLFAALALGATLCIIHFSNRVPTRPLVAEEIDYPVTGKVIEITAASTYWRAPVTTGENADVVRRGTQLIPVIKMSIRSKSGAIRVFFRNEEGIVVGDGITRSVSGDAELSIAATAGFEDIGMHTAYRTGDSLPWVVQVFEGKDATAPREEFRMVLETEISTLTR